MARGGQLPDRTQLERAAAILNQAEKPFILVGQGALGAGQELLEMAEKLGAPIGKALLGKGAVPDLSDYSTGGVGLLGTRPSQDALEGRSEEHTSELQSLMRISYAVFCLKKKKTLVGTEI